MTTSRPRPHSKESPGKGPQSKGPGSGGPRSEGPRPERDEGPRPVDGEWPRDFGRDGVSGLLGPDRALRARDVSRPGPEDQTAAEQVVDQLIARASGRRRR